DDVLRHQRRVRVPGNELAEVGLHRAGLVEQRKPPGVSTSRSPIRRPLLALLDGVGPVVVPANLLARLDLPHGALPARPRREPGRARPLLLAPRVAAGRSAIRRNHRQAAPPRQAAAPVEPGTL